MTIFKYSLDHNEIMIVVTMQSNVDVNQINSNVQVFFRPHCYYHYCSYAIECGWKSDQ